MLTQQPSSRWDICLRVCVRACICGVCVLHFFFSKHFWRAELWAIQPALSLFLSLALSFSLRAATNADVYLEFFSSLNDPEGALFSSRSVSACFTLALLQRVRLPPSTFASTSDFKINRPPPLPTPRLPPPLPTPLPSVPYLHLHGTWPGLTSPRRHAALFVPWPGSLKVGFWRRVGKVAVCCRVSSGGQEPASSSNLSPPPQLLPPFYLSLNKRCRPLDQLPCLPCCFFPLFPLPPSPSLLPFLPLSPRCH